MHLYAHGPPLWFPRNFKPLGHLWEHSTQSSDVLLHLDRPRKQNIILEMNVQMQILLESFATGSKRKTKRANQRRTAELALDPQPSIERIEDMKKSINQKPKDESSYAKQPRRRAEGIIAATEQSERDPKLE